MSARNCLLLALAVIPLAACLSAPLGPPGSIKPDVALLGKWQCVGNRDGERKEAQLEVVRFDDSQYYAEWIDGGEKSRYRAYATRVGGATLVNVTELNGRFTPWPWAVVRVSNMRDKTFDLELLDTEALRSHDEKAARREIAERAKDPSVYKALASCSARED
jgi:hypothetical protein